jgi:hypothetical protein
MTSMIMYKKGCNRMFGAGLGAGKGWLSSYFFITPNELEKLIESLDLHFVCTNQRVKKEYYFTSKEEMLEVYSSYYESILSGKKIDWKLKSDLRIGVTKSLDIVLKDKEFISDDIEYKTFALKEPIINFRPVELYRKGDSFSYKTMITGECFCLGIEYNFPKYITFFEDSNGEYIGTDNFTNCILYHQFKDEIKKFTIGCRVTSGEREIKTDIRISKESREKLKCMNSLEQLGLRVL